MSRIPKLYTMLDIRIIRLHRRIPRTHAHVHTTLSLLLSSRTRMRLRCSARSSRRLNPSAQRNVWIQTLHPCRCCSGHPWSMRCSSSSRYCRVWWRRRPSRGASVSRSNSSWARSWSHGHPGSRSPRTIHRRRRTSFNTIPRMVDGLSSDWRRRRRNTASSSRIRS